MAVRQNKIILAIMILILLVFISGGFFLRVWKLGDSSLWIDEGYTINASQAILEHGYPLLDSGKIYNGWFIPNYITAGFMALFSFDPFSPWSARLPAALFGTAVVLAVFLLSQTLFNNQAISFTAAFLTSFSQWGIAWSRQARGYTMLSFFILVSLLFVWKFLQPAFQENKSPSPQTGEEEMAFKSRQKKFAFYAVIAFVISYFINSLSLLLLPAIFFWWLMHSVAKKQILQKVSWKLFALIMVGIFIGALIFYELAILFTELETDAFSPSYLYFLFNNLRVLSFGILLGLILGFFDKKRLASVTFIFLSITLPIFIIIQYGPRVQLRYLFPFFPLILILFSYALYRCIEISLALLRHLPVFRDGIKPQVAGVTTFILAITITFPYLNFTPKDFYALEFGSPQPDFKTVFSVIKNEQTPEDIILSPYTQLHKIYLNEKGVWLPMSLSGKTSKLNRQIAEGQDYYTGAPLVENQEHLERLLDKESGFIVIDNMSVNRLKGQAFFIAHYPKTKLLYHSGKGSNEIWVYEF